MRKRVWAISALATMIAAGSQSALAAPKVAIQGPQLNNSTANELVHQAQFSIQIGGGKGRARKTLRQAGYTDIVVTYTGLTKTLAEACQNGTRYKIELHALGGIRGRNDIGKCAGAEPVPEIDLAAMRRTMRKKGYGDLKIVNDRDPRSVLVTSCVRGRLFDLTYDATKDRLIRQAKTGRRCTAVAVVDQQALRAKLRADGYNRIQFTALNPPVIRAEACDRRRRVSLRMDVRGNIRQAARIGRCAPPKPQVNIADLEDALAKEGYEQVVFTDRKLPNYVAEACIDGRKFELTFNRFGEKTNEERIGRCRRGMTPEQVAEKLRTDGYNRIKFTDDKLPRYVAEACNRRNRRVELRLNRFGEVRRQNRIGRCQPALDEPGIRQSLRDKGYNRIDIKRNRLSSGRLSDVEACNARNRRMEMKISPYGEVTRERRIGRCPSEASLPDIRKQLVDKGFNRVKFTDRKLPRYVAEACNRLDRRFEISLNRWGEIRKQVRVGRCAPEQSVAQITKALETKGFSQVVFTDKKLPGYAAEMCDSRNRKFVTTFNRWGEQIEQTRSGRCRPIPTRNEVKRKLQNEGYDRLRFVSATLPGIVEACQRRDKVLLTVNKYGEVTRERTNGRCRPAEPEDGMGDYRRALRGEGYKQIRFTDKELPRIVAEACRDNRRYRVVLNRRARIRREVPIGRCLSGSDRTDVTPREIRKNLQARGFNRIKFTDRQLPKIVAEACSAGRQYELTFDRSGNLTNQERIGRFSRRCRTDRGDGLSISEITEALEARRYYNVEFTDRRLPRYVAEACRNRNKFEIRLNRFGGIQSRRRVGFCEAPGRSVANIAIPRFSESELSGTRRISADTCQDYIEYILYQDTVLFDVASAQISDESVPLLRRLSGLLNRCPEATVEIAGHTDSDGSATANQRLSDRRARSVLEYMNDRGVRRSRLTAVGYGEGRPTAPNNSSANKALNRRIEFVMNWEGDDN